VLEIHKRKEVKTMKYETPELTALTPAINAVQGQPKALKNVVGDSPSPTYINEFQVGYVDWED
jgi:hypothetical protein